MGKKFFTLSFDDGTIQDVRFVNILNKYGLKCTFNLNSGLFGTKHRIVHYGIECDHTELTAKEVEHLYDGHEVASHTSTHPDLRKIALSEATSEVAKDCKELKKIFGYDIIGLAYPGGDCYNNTIIKSIQANTTIKYARNVNNTFNFEFPYRFMEWRPTCGITDESVFNLADDFINAKSDEDLLFYVWGHSFEFDKFKSWDRLAEFCKKIAGKPDIIYCTNKFVYNMKNNCINA